jgi:hypothetical protein
LLHAGFSRKSLFSQLLLKGNKEMEATGPHNANRTCNFLRRCYKELPKTSLYSPDLVHSDFHLLGREWQAVCNRRQPAARSPPGYRHWHQFVSTVAQMLKCQWWQRGYLMHTVCYVATEVKIKFSANEYVDYSFWKSFIQRRGQNAWNCKSTST